MRRSVTTKIKDAALTLALIVLLIPAAIVAIPILLLLLLVSLGSGVHEGSMTKYITPISFACVLAFCVAVLTDSRLFGIAILCFAGFLCSVDIESAEP